MWDIWTVGGGREIEGREDTCISMMIIFDMWQETNHRILQQRVAYILKDGYMSFMPPLPRPGTFLLRTFSQEKETLYFLNWSMPLPHFCRETQVPGGRRPTQAQHHAERAAWCYGQPRIGQAASPPQAQFTSHAACCLLCLSSKNSLLSGGIMNYALLFPAGTGHFTSRKWGNLPWKYAVSWCPLLNTEQQDLERWREAKFLLTKGAMCLPSIITFISIPLSETVPITGQ